MEMWYYKLEGSRPAAIRFSLQISRYGTNNQRSNDQLSGASESEPQAQKASGGETTQRERINSSIEQLKSLLGPEFFKRQPESKLEKADILDMAVCFLRQLHEQRHPAVNSGAADLGYSRCVQEVVNFLSKDELHTQSQRRLLNNFSKLPTSSEKNLKGAPQCRQAPIKMGAR